MIDPDVPEGACICRPDDKAMAMGHTHYCVNRARRTAFGSRLPKAVEQALLDAAPDERHRSFRKARLDFNRDEAMRDPFTQALDSPGLTLFRDQCEDDPCEIVVRGRGEARGGSYWCNLNIILLDPAWSKDADLSEALADDIVTHWDRLVAASRPAA